MRAYDLATVVESDDIGLRLQMGVTQFLAGRYVEAERELALTDYIRARARERWGVDNRNIRFLGDSWFAAIGHVACIDSYIKAMELGWRPRMATHALVDPDKPPPGVALLRRFSAYIDVQSTPHKERGAVAGRVIGAPADRDPVADHAKRRLESLTEEFWYGPDGNGRIRWYAPLNAEVERAWKAAGRGPLLTIGEEERTTTRRMLAQVFGLPEDAWFVALHVREPGFHASWHRAHPGTRHADIAAYDRVIDMVTAAGGWVVRLGDRSMTGLPPRPRVIDYATSSFRNFDLDVFLCATCLYFVGTNSGLSLLPPLFGQRAVLTNWSPIAIPNWYLDDVYIPKLVRDERTGRHLSFGQMFGSIAGWTQWRRDYPEGVQTIEDNTADDLVDAVAELHAEVVEGVTVSAADQSLIDRFNAIAVDGGSYVGSRISARFLRKHQHLLD
jgi:putative glycosyltransferase (TIGR04372 family)